MQGSQDMFPDWKKKKSTAKEEYLYHMLDTPETDIRTFNIQVINQFTSENF